MKVFLFWLSLPIYLVDQASKWAVVSCLPLGSSLEVVPGFFNLVHVANTGAAFGIMKGANGFFIGLSVVALCVLGVLIWRGVFWRVVTRVGAGLLVAGVCGNLTDRIVHGHVVDFLDFVLPWYGHWPAFNVADSCLCVAAGLFILDSFFEGRGGKGEAKGGG